MILFFFITYMCYYDHMPMLVFCAPQEHRKKNQWLVDFDLLVRRSDSVAWPAPLSTRPPAEWPPSVRSALSSSQGSLASEAVAALVGGEGVQPGISALPAALHGPAAFLPGALRPGFFGVRLPGLAEDACRQFEVSFLLHMYWLVLCPRLLILVSIFKTVFVAKYNCFLLCV